MKRTFKTPARSFLFLFLLLLPIARAQAVGEWGIYQGYTLFTQLEAFRDHLYVKSSSGSLFTYNIQTEETAELTRITGLSDSKVQFLAHSPEADVLAVVYSNGNIDFIDSEGAIYNLPDVKNKSMMGDKTIYGYHQEGDKLYIGMGIGLVVINMALREVEASYLFGLQCDLAFTYGDRLYMSDTDGLHYCPLSLNAYDRNNWSTLTTVRVKDIATFQQDSTTVCWMVMQDKTTQILSQEGQMTRFSDFAYFTSIKPMNGYVFMRGNGLMMIDPQDQSFAWATYAPFGMVVDFVAAGDSLYYMLHQTTGLCLARLTERKKWGSLNMEILWDGVAMNGLRADALYQLTYAHGILGGIASDPTTLYSGGVNDLDGVLSTLEDGVWHNTTAATLSPPLNSTYAFRALTSLAADPVTPGRYYVGSIYEGFYHVEGDSLLAHYDHTNSNIESLWVDRVASILPDADGNVWFANAGVTDVLKCHTADGEWRSYPISGFSKVSYVSRLMQAVNDPYRFKWLVSPRNGCALYYDGGTPTDLSDDESAAFSSMTDQDGNSITPTSYHDAVEDRTGKVWILTTSGPFVVDSQIEAFNNPGRVRRVKIPRNDGTNLADYLLAGVNTQCMVVDAADRKWIGTKGSGLYLLSSDGLEQIEHFTQDNCPLPDDDILSLAIDDESGTLFISTNGGTLTYKTDAVGGSQSFDKVYCWPNPVRPDYEGDLHVTGLMDRSEVRITDVNNNVIFATTSSGGMISWNLRNASSHRVKSGVYLIYGRSEDGKKDVVTKLLVVR